MSNIRRSKLVALKITNKSIAQELEVSEPTVSLVLSGKRTSSRILSYIDQRIKSAQEKPRRKAA